MGSFGLDLPHGRLMVRSLLEQVLLEQALLKQLLMPTETVGLVFGVVLGLVSPQVQAKPTDSDEEFAAPVNQRSPMRRNVIYVQASRLVFWQALPRCRAFCSAH